MPKRQLIFVLKTVPLIILALFLFFSFVSAASGTPTIISYQGRLTNSSGDLLGDSGTTYYFKFSIYDNSATTSGNRLWPSSDPATTTATVRQGVFNVNIGDTANGYPDPLIYNFNTNQTVYLQVQVSSTTNAVMETLSPRQQITAAAFAELAGAVSGTSTPSSFGTTSPVGNSAVTIEASSSGALPLSIRAASGQTARLLQVQDSSAINLFYLNSSGALFASSTLQVTGNSIFYGNLGIGTTTPGATLGVEGSALISGNLTLANLTATGSLQVARPLSASSTLSVAGLAKLDGAFISVGSSTVAGTLNVTGAIQASSSVTVANTLSVTGLSNLVGGLISSASSTVAGTLQVAGALTASSTLSADRLQVGSGTSTFVGGIRASNLDLSGTSATSTFANGIQLTGGNVQLLLTGCNGTSVLETSATGNLQCGEDGGGAVFAWTPRVDGNATTTRILLDNGFISSASSTVAGPFHVSGALNASSTLLANGLSTLTGGFISSASSTIAGPLQVAGPVQASSSATISGTLAVSGLSNLAGFISSASSTVAAPLQIAGFLQASSSVSLATTTITGTVDSNLAATGTTPILTLNNTSSATNTAVRLAFQASQANNVATTTSAITSLLVQNADIFASGATTSGAGALVFSVLNNGILSEAGRLTDARGLIVQGSSTISNSLNVARPLSASSTLSVAGLSTQVGGFISSASSTVAGALNVTGAIQASSSLTLASTLGVSGLANLNAAFISSGSSTIAGPLQLAGALQASSSVTVANTLGVTGLSNLVGGLISSASSTVAGTLQVAGALTASSTLSADRIMVGTGTSTFVGGIRASNLDLSGTSATSTAANGFDLSAGCFSIRGTCVGGGGGGSSNWTDGGAYLTPLTATDGVIVYASSTFSSLLSVTGNLYASSSVTFSGGSINYLSSATSTIIDNVPYAWTIATTSTATPFFRIDTTNNAEEIVIGTGFNRPGATTSKVMIGGRATGTITDLEFAASSTIYAVGNSRLATSTLTFGQGNNIINFAVNTGFGTTSPYRKLSVVGTVAFDGLTSTSTLTDSLCIGFNDEVLQRAAASCNTASSLRFKENIETLTATSGLETIMALNPVSFYYKPSYLGSYAGNPNWAGEHVGFIAEEVRQIDPRLVTIDSDGKPDTVHYENLTSLLTKGVQQLVLRLDGISSTTASSTPDSESFASNFFKNIFERVKNWLADAANEIGEIFANTFRAKEKICVDDQCLTKDDIRKLLELANQAAVTATTGGTGTTTLEPAPEPTPIIDTELPVITLNGSAIIEIAVGTSWVDPGATVTDNVNNNLGIHYTVDGVLTGAEGNQLPHEVIDTSIVGEHTIIYSATDQARNTGTATRVLTVFEPQLTTNNSTITTATTTEPQI